MIWGNWLSFGPQLTREQRRLQNRICLHFKEDKDKNLPSVVFLNSARSRFCSEHFSRTTHVLNVYCRSKNRVWSLLSWLQPHLTSKTSGTHPSRSLQVYAGVAAGLKENVQRGRESWGIFLSVCVG